METQSKNLVPNDIELTKKDILDFCDRVIERWQKDPSISGQNFVSMYSVRTSVSLTDDESLKAIWNEILRWTFELLYKNAIAQTKDDTMQPKMTKKHKTTTKNTRPEILGEWF